MSRALAQLSWLCDMGRSRALFGVLCKRWTRPMQSWELRSLKGNVAALCQLKCSVQTTFVLSQVGKLRLRGVK